MQGSTRVWAAGLALLVVLVASLLASANQPPVARISAYRAGSTTAVTFDGSASTDADGKVVRFQWLFGDGTTGSGSPVTHSYPQQTSYTVTLVVGDNANATTLTTQVINIASLPSQAASAETQAAPATTPPASTAQVGNRTGQRAPEIALPTLDGGMAYLSSYLGKTVLVEFWQSTCPGCQASTPQLEAYRAKYAEDGLVVMLVVLDRNPSAAMTWLRDHGFTQFVLAWESSSAKPTMNTYGVAVTPHAFLIDPTGVIRYAGHPVSLTEDFLIRWL